MTSTIYLAGPGVFRPDAREFGGALKALCARYGCEGLFPLDNEIVADPVDKLATAKWIYEANIALMERADAIVADISPFRGVNMDPGTAFEIGWFVARGKPVFCWTNDNRVLIERASTIMSTDTPGYDIAGWLVEDFDLPENLMIAIPATSIFPSVEEAIAAAAARVKP